MELEQYDLTQGLDGLLALIRDEYPDGEMADSQYLEWEYEKNPNGAPVMTVVKSSAREVVGQYLVIPVSYYVEGNVVEGSLSLNTLTRVDYRGKGLFTKMALETYEHCKSKGLQLTLGFPNKSSYPGFVRKLGFLHIGNVVLLVKPLRWGALVKGALLRHRFPKYQSFKSQEVLNPVPKETLGGVCFSQFDLEADAEIYQEFMEKRIKRLNQTNRTVSYLKWRYDEIPTRNYSLFKVTKDGRLLAYIVLRMRIVYGMKAGFIIDFNCLEGEESEGAAKALIVFAKRVFKRAGAVFVGCLITTKCAEHKVLKQCGFFQAPTRFLPHDAPVIVRWNDDSDMPASLGSIDNWFLTFGDYDAF